MPDSVNVIIKEVTTLEVLERLEHLENQNAELKSQVSKLVEETKSLLQAFHAAQGAFVFLDWLARVVKPMLYLGGLLAAVILWVKGVRI